MILDSSAIIATILQEPAAAVIVPLLAQSEQLAVGKYGHVCRAKRPGAALAPGGWTIRTSERPLPNQNGASGDAVSRPCRLPERGPSTRGPATVCSRINVFVFEEEPLWAPCVPERRGLPGVVVLVECR